MSEYKRDIVMALQVLNPKQEKLVIKTEEGENISPEPQNTTAENINKKLKSGCSMLFFLLIKRIVDSNRNCKLDTSITQVQRN